MAQDLDTETAAFPSYETFEEGVTATDVGEAGKRRIEQIADEMAERANNTIKSYEDTAPDQQLFTK
jgi:hypothetical protein